jgi:hypothetical protein
LDFAEKYSKLETWQFHIENPILNKGNRLKSEAILWRKEQIKKTKMGKKTMITPNRKKGHRFAHKRSILLANKMKSSDKAKIVSSKNEAKTKDGIYFFKDATFM